MSDNKISIEVDGQTLEATGGQMLIEVTDANGIYIPRFCYHEKLTIAANCRMCLVEMEKGRKPMPACATPVGDGMKFFTRSKAAIEAQRATMEFLLINHPLDCPICDQGGECELQDLAVGYGRGVSRYAETKRAVEDKELGSLVSTDMTRCIHCTRCVRFGEEIAGIQELGTIGRGENVEIAPYIAKTVDHELSGNIIDLCPVGALNSKPFRFRARSWEMEQADGVSPHDCFGSNLHVHLLRGKIMRVVPRTNEELNETWISDRDRFAYTGLYTEDRVTEPMVKRDGEWVTTDWATALAAATDGIKKATSQDRTQLGVLAAPWATVEELHLLERLARGTGSDNIDHRLQQIDFSDQTGDADYPGLGMAIADIDNQQAITLLGCRVRQEVPMLAHRVRKAHSNGAAVSIVNESNDDYLFKLDANVVSDNLLNDVAALASAANASVPTQLQSTVASADVTDTHRRIVSSLKEADNAAVFLGHAATRHVNFGAIRALASALAKSCSAHLAVVGLAANSAGAAMVGALPHRTAGARKAAQLGLDTQAMLNAQLGAYVTFGIELESDVANGTHHAQMLQQSHVVALTSYLTEAMRSYADVILPVAAFGESAGTYVNAEGRWQSMRGVALPRGDARPGWKVVRVLANSLGIDGFDMNSAEEVLAASQQAAGDLTVSNVFAGDKAAVNAPANALSSGLYQSDPIVRRAAPLQEIGVETTHNVDSLKATG
ncbi:MAG: NADH-quinone oxidoreductase subunit NuoG [Gammaproteobacteria bacterium]